MWEDSLLPRRAPLPKAIINGRCLPVIRCKVIDSKVLDKLGKREQGSIMQARKEPRSVSTAGGCLAQYEGCPAGACKTIGALR